MKKATINNILMAVIVLMSVSICFLIFCIVTRPRYSTVVSSPEPAIITESETLAESLISDTSTDSSEDLTVSTQDTIKGKTSSRVNIRDAASADAKVLDTVDADTILDIIEIQSNGWTKIIYDNSEAYVSSDYVIIINE